MVVVSIYLPLQVGGQIIKTLPASVRMGFIKVPPLPANVRIGFIKVLPLPADVRMRFMKVLPLPANVGRQSVLFWDGIHGGKYRPIPYLIMVTEPLMVGRPLLGLMM